MERIIPTHAGKSGFNFRKNHSCLCSLREDTQFLFLSSRTTKCGGGGKPFEPLSQNTLKKMEANNMNH